jgi:hypothetical protein
MDMKDTNEKVKMNKKKKKIVLLAALIVLACVFTFEIASMLGGMQIFKVGTTSIPTATVTPDYGDFTLPVAGVRPYAVMIDNEYSMPLPQGGLYRAQIIYEAFAEGGETRFMAVFWGKGSTKIGPVRSARHYFLDYAMENNAIYVHVGYSPYAKRDIKLYDIDDINGIFVGGVFWDITKEGSNWSDSYTSTDKINAYVKSHKWPTTTTRRLVFSYNPADVEPVGGFAAKNVTIKYAASNQSGYVYDSAAKLYKRLRKGEPLMERVTGKQLTAKNIIIQKIRNYTMPGETKSSRQGLDNVGTGEGWYVSLGKAVKIKWSKASRTEQTKYTLASSGAELIINPGQTWVQIMPINYNPVIK